MAPRKTNKNKRAGKRGIEEISQPTAVAKTTANTRAARAAKRSRPSSQPKTTKTTKKSSKKSTSSGSSSVSGGGGSGDSVRDSRETRAARRANLKLTKPVSAPEVKPVEPKAEPISAPEVQPVEAEAEAEATRMRLSSGGGDEAKAGDKDVSRHNRLVLFVQRLLEHYAALEKSFTPRVSKLIESFVDSVVMGDRASAATQMIDLRENLPPSVFIKAFGRVMTSYLVSSFAFWITPECVEFLTLLRESIFDDEHKDTQYHAWEMFLTLSDTAALNEEWPAEAVTIFANFVHDQGMFEQFSGQIALDEYLRGRRSGVRWDRTPTCTKAVLDGFAASKLKVGVTDIPMELLLKFIPLLSA